MDKFFYMYGLHFSKEGIFFSEWNENIVQKQTTNLITEGISIRNFYSHFVTFDDNLSVGDLLSLLYVYKTEIEKDFCSYMGHYKLRPFVTEASKEARFTKKYDLSDISRYELYWNCDVSYSYDGDGDVIVDAPKYLDFQVFGHAVNRLYNPDDEMSSEFYSLAHMPLRNWKHLPIVLNENFYISEILHSEMKEIIYFNGKKRFTVFEAIAGFLNELTMNGSPAEQRKMFSELNKELKNLEKQRSEGLDSEEDIKMNEELFLSWEKDKLAKYHKEEKYEKASVSKKTIEILEELIILKKNLKEEDLEAKKKIENLSKQYYKLKNW